MKKYLQIATGVMATVAVVGAAQAAAFAVCSGNAGTNGATVTANSKFVQTGFIPKCSNNVFMSYDEEQTYGAVGAASKKGKNAFKGNSVGGGVLPGTTACAASGCAATDATTALTAAMAEASSGMAASQSASSSSSSAP